MPLIKTKDDYYKYLDNILAGTTQIQTRPMPAETTFGGIDTTSSTTSSTTLSDTLSPSAIGMARNAPVYNKNQYLEKLQSVLETPFVSPKVAPTIDDAKQGIQGLLNRSTIGQEVTGFGELINQPARAITNVVTAPLREGGIQSTGFESYMKGGEQYNQYEKWAGKEIPLDALKAVFPPLGLLTKGKSINIKDLGEILLDPNNAIPLGGGGQTLLKGLLKVLDKGVDITRMSAKELQPLIKELGTSEVGSAFGDISKGIKKEPWQMTRDEYTIFADRSKTPERITRNTQWNAIQKILAENAKQGRRNGLITKEQWRNFINKYGYPESVTNDLFHYMDDPAGAGVIVKDATTTEVRQHYSAVTQALSEGKPVPPEVLKDYPDLVKNTATEVKNTAIPTKGTEIPKVWNRDTVNKALWEHRDVPPEILEQYPDLISGHNVNMDFARQWQLVESGKYKTGDMLAYQGKLRPIDPEDIGKDYMSPGMEYSTVYRPRETTLPKVEPKPPVEPPVKPQAISSEVPPVKPPKMPTTETSPVPKVPPSGIDDALKQADAIVKNDRPGLITNLIDRIPGLKQLQRGIHPAVGMKESILKGWIGLGHTRATISNTLHADLLPVVSKLDDSFGKGSSAGNKVNIKFIGTPEQQVPFTGTLYDIMQRPQLYELTDLQKTLLTNIQANKLTNLQKYKGLYNLEIGEFPTSPGAVHLANVDKSKTGILMAGSENATLARGRAKTRFYETGADRYQHDIELYKQGKIKKEDVFDPNLDVGRLLNADHETLSAMAGQNVFKTALGGKTKLEVMQEVNPELAKKMEALRKRVQKLQGYKNVLKEEQSQAIDNFLNSNMESDDLLYLRDSLELKPGRYVAKVEAGKTLPDIQKEIDGVRLQIKALQPAWKTANPRGYVSVNEGGLYQYFKAEDAKAIRKLLKTSDNPVLRYIDELRSTAFGGDLSPGSIQGVNAWLADPIGVSKAIAKEIKNNKSNLFASFSEIDLAKDVKANPESWNRFTQATGLNPLGKFQREEFGTGFIARIPKIGGKWAEANDALYRGLVRISKDSFDSIYEQGIKQGLSAEKAAAIAADDVTKLIPSYSYRRLGLSQKQSAIYRAALTSVSFLKQPVNLMSDAVKGLVKLGTFRKVSPAEAYAMKRTLTLASMVSTIAVTSNVIYAKNHGKDPAKAALASVTPGDPYFWSLVLPNGDRIGLGGPFRSLIKAVAPGKLGNIPFPVPFAGVGKFAMGKMNPGVKIAYDEIRNKDYYGKQIRTGEFPINILQGLEYAFEGAAPLTLGSALEDIRRGETEKIPTDVASQFAGVNLTKQDKVWDLTREWTSNKDFVSYDAISKDDPEAQTKRTEWRKNNPQGDAKLFISGEVDSIETISGAANAIKLIKDNGIDPKQIDSLNKYYTDHPDYAKLGYSDIDPIDILAYKLSGKPYTQDYVNKLNYLSLKDRYKEVQKQYDAIQYGDTYEDNKKESADRQALLNSNPEYRDGLRRNEVLNTDSTASISIQNSYIKYFAISGEDQGTKRDDYRRSNPEFEKWLETYKGYKPLETKKATTKTGSTPFR